MRRKNDFYPTPSWATRLLSKHVQIIGNVLECCAGDGAIADALGAMGSPVGTIYRNDIDHLQPHLDFTIDAADPQSWDDFHYRDFDWTVTNPPFSHAAQIVPLAYEHSVFGVAMLLRLSYLEPVEDRGAWLNDHPPTTLIVLPRISFTGDGKTDNVTCAWMVWEKESASHAITQRIIVAENPRFTRSEPIQATASASAVNATLAP